MEHAFASDWVVGEPFCSCVLRGAQNDVHTPHLMRNSPALVFAQQKLSFSSQQAI